MCAVSPSWTDSCAQAAGLAPAARGSGRAARPPVASLRLDAAQLPRRDWFEAWRAYNAGLFEIFPPGDGAASSAPQATAWRVGGIVASTTACPALRFQRSGALIKRSQDRLLLRLYTRGSLRAVLDGEPLKMQPGEFHLFDVMRPFCGVSDAAANFSVAIPYGAVGYEPRRHASRFGLHAHSPAGRLLAAGLEALYAQAPCASADEGVKLAEGFAGLLNGVLFGANADDAVRSTVERHRAAAIVRYVDAHFADPAISAERVGHAVGASRATVYRVFAPAGGLKRAVLDRRLRAAVTELSQTPARRGAVAVTAARWGFDRPAWFARRCRERFGYRPSDVLGLAAPPDRATALAAARDPAEVAVPRLLCLYD
jgi:AraC-like DNA-binding protein